MFLQQLLATTDSFLEKSLLCVYSKTKMFRFKCFN